MASTVTITLRIDPDLYEAIMDVQRSLQHRKMSDTLRWLLGKAVQYFVFQQEYAKRQPPTSPAKQRPPIVRDDWNPESGI